MNPDLSNKTVMWVDNGLFPAFLRRVAPAFKRAYYYSAWQAPFPSYKQTKLGEGYPEFERVNYPLLKADEVDLWVFADICYGDLQTFLAERGARVFGSRMGEEMEIDRAAFKELLKRVGLPVGPWELVKGTDALQKFLQGKADTWWVKGRYGFSRRDMETWKWKGAHVSGDFLKEKIHDLGPFANDFEFVVEQELPDRVEIGYDGFVIDDKFPDHAMQAYEVKGVGMIGTVKAYGKLAEAVRQVNAALAPVFKQYGYRGAFASEIRYGKDKKPFCIDPCCRFGSPSNELLQELFSGDDWARAMWEGAEGRIYSPRPVAKYATCLMVYAEESGRNWQPLEFPKGLDRWVKLRNPYRKGSRSYYVPQGEKGNLAGVVGVGETLEASIRAAEAHAEEVKGQLIEIGTEAIGKARETIEEGKKYGIEF